MQRLKDRFLGWALRRPADPVVLLKQSIRELEDQVPGINAGLSRLKDELIAAERELARLRGASGEPQARLELQRASRAYAEAQQAKREFMARKEAQIQAAKQALVARRQADWMRRVAGELQRFEAALEASGDAEAVAHRCRREAGQAESELTRVLDLGAAAPQPASSPGGADPLRGELLRRALRAQHQLDDARSHLSSLEARLERLEAQEPGH